MAQEPRFIDTKELSLEQWLELLFDPPGDIEFVSYEFPTDEHRQQYLATIEQRSEEEVYRLLENFLFPSGTMGGDEWALDGLQRDEQERPEMFEWKISRQYYRRLLLHAHGHPTVQPWEGTTWILDLLPHFPRQAIEGLNAYIVAHIQQLPDGRYRGLHEVIEIIRAKFIGVPGTKSETIKYLLDLGARDFECLIERFYHNMGYKTLLTPETRDRGRDIIAKKDALGHHEHLLIECRRFGPIGVGAVRELLGVVGDEKAATKGVLVTADRFTPDAEKYAARNRLELINGDQLVILMNEYLGPKWPLHIDRLIANSLRNYQKTIADN